MSVPNRPRSHYWELVNTNYEVWPRRKSLGHLIYLFKGAAGPQVLSLPLLPHGKGGSFLHHMVLPWHDVSHRPQTVMEFNLSNRAEPLLFINHLAGIPRCSKGKLRSLCLYMVCLQHLLHACSGTLLDLREWLCTEQSPSFLLLTLQWRITQNEHCEKCLAHAES